MKNTTILGMVIILLIASGLFVFGGAKEPSITGNVVAGAALDGNVQKITLGLKDFNYYPSTIKVKAGKPVKIYGDADLIKKGGCLKSLTIRELGESAYLRSATDSLDVTINEPGVYTLTCAMGMGYAKLIVE